MLLLLATGLQVPDNQTVMEKTKSSIISGITPKIEEKILFKADIQEEEVLPMMMMMRMRDHHCGKPSIRLVGRQPARRQPLDPQHIGHLAHQNHLRDFTPGNNCYMGFMQQQQYMQCIWEQVSQSTGLVGLEVKVMNPSKPGKYRGHNNLKKFNEWLSHLLLQSNFSVIPFSSFLLLDILIHFSFLLMG